MSGSVPGGGPKAEPNLTPMLDMVFQLVTFFMMVMNFKAAELDQTLKLPVIGSARPLPPTPDGSRKVLVLNVHEENSKACLSLNNKILPESEIKPYLQIEAQASELASKITHDDIVHGKETLPDIIIIRADRTCSFGSVNEVTTDCQSVGYRNFAFTAYPEDPDKPHH
jgi:biopolymer transport protein ExbD